MWGVYGVWGVVWCVGCVCGMWGVVWCVGCVHSVHGGEGCVSGNFSLVARLSRESLGMRLG